MILRALFLRPVRRAPLRFLATLLGIASGVAGFVATLAANRAALAALREDTRVLAGAAALEIRSTAGVPPETLALLRGACADAEVLPVIEELVLEPASGAVLRLVGIDPLADARLSGFAPSELDERGLQRLLLGEGVWASAGLAHELGLAPGAKLALEARGRAHVPLLLGTFATGPGQEAFERVLLADLSLAERISGRAGRLDRIELVPRPGVAAAELEARLRPLLPSGLELGDTGARARQTDALVRSLEFNLLALSGIALLVAGVLVATGLATSVVQRRATLALLVSLGARRAELAGAIVCEALALGGLGGLAGAAGGLLGARMLAGEARATLGTLVGSVPESAVRFDPALLALGCVLGLAVAAASAILPALEIARTPPLQSLARERPGLLSARARVGALGAAILLALAAVELGRLPAWRGLPVAALGAASTLLAALFVLQGPLCDALARAAARLPALLALLPPLRLAVAAVAAGRRRSAWAAGAVALSVALSASIATLVHSFRTTVDEWCTRALRTDLQVTPLAPRGGVPLGQLDPGVTATCVRLFGADAVDPFHSALASVDGRSVVLVGAAREVVAARGGFPYRDGRDSRSVLARAVASGDAVASEAFALHFGRGEGERVRIETPGGALEKRIEGVYHDYADNQGTLIVDLAEFAARYPARGPRHVEVYLPAGSDVEAARAELVDALQGEFHVVVRTGAELRAHVLAIFDRTFAITRALALVSAFVAVIAVLTVLFALLRERSLDLALLRALGASRLELGAQVTLQSGLLGALGAAGGVIAGLVIGVLLVGVVNRQSFGWTLGFHQPWSALAELLVAVLLACLGAGLAPAWLAARARGSAALREDG